MERLSSELMDKIMKNDSAANNSAAENTSRNCPQPEGEFPLDMPVGMCYVPMQRWEKIYDNSMALERGTIFKALDKPFIGEEAVRNAR